MTQKDKTWQEKTGKGPKNPPKNEENPENEENLSQNDENIDENKSETEILQEKLAAEQEKSDTLNDKLLRAFAELENVRRRSKEELEKTSNYAISNFVTDLVVVAENFFLACDNMPNKQMEADNEVKNFAIGVDMTKKELMKILEKIK